MHLPRIAGLLAFACLLLAGGCSTWGTSGANAVKDEHRPVRPRLSVAEVKKLAAARAQKNGFSEQASAPWQITLDVQDSGLRWCALLPRFGQGNPFWLLIDDATGAAEFVTPEIHIEQNEIPGADWLSQVYNGLRAAKYPILLETLMRDAHCTSAQFSMGGSELDGLLEFAWDR